MKNTFWRNVGYLLGLSGFGIWTYQIYYWLHYASWKSFSMLSVSPYDSKYYPHTWIGLQKILDFIPLSIVLIILGLIFAISNDD